MFFFQPSFKKRTVEFYNVTCQQNCRELYRHFPRSYLNFASLKKGEDYHGNWSPVRSLIFLSWIWKNQQSSHNRRGCFAWLSLCWLRQSIISYRNVWASDLDHFFVEQNFGVHLISKAGIKIKKTTWWHISLIFLSSWIWKN